MIFIVKRNIYTNEIVDIYENMNIAAKEIGVTIQSILQAIKKHTKCKNYYWECINIDKEKILMLCNDL